MPKIQWSNLPRTLRQRLFDRLAERRITAEDLYELKSEQGIQKPIFVIVQNSASQAGNNGLWR